MAKIKRKVSKNNTKADQDRRKLDDIAKVILDGIHEHVVAKRDQHDSLDNEALTLIEKLKLGSGDIRQLIMHHIPDAKPTDEGLKSQWIELNSALEKIPDTEDVFEEISALRQAVVKQQARISHLEAWNKCIESRERGDFSKNGMKDFWMEINKIVHFAAKVASDYRDQERNSNVDEKRVREVIDSCFIHNDQADAITSDEQDADNQSGPEPEQREAGLPA